MEEYVEIDESKRLSNEKIHKEKIRKSKIINNTYKDGGYKDEDEEVYLTNPVPDGRTLYIEKDVRVVDIVTLLMEDEEMKDYFVMFPEMIDEIIVNDLYDKLSTKIWKFESKMVIFSVIVEILDIKPVKLYRFLSNKNKNELIKELNNFYNFI